MQTPEMKEDFNDIYDNIDKMKEMKRYRAPTPGYFPTLAELNTFINSGKEHMLPYFMWLEDNLTDEEREQHKDAIKRLNEFVQEIE